jgi:hypothetical protein
MKIIEWTERNLYVNKDLKVLDNSMNEYRDDDGQIQYLELPNRLFKRMNDVLEDMYFKYANKWWVAGMKTFIKKQRLNKAKECE